MSSLLQMIITISVMNMPKQIDRKYGTIYGTMADWIITKILLDIGTTSQLGLSVEIKIKY